MSIQRDTKPTLWLPENTDHLMWFLGTTKTAPTVRNATHRVSCVPDLALLPAGPVHLLFWSCKAPSCVLSAAHNASMRSMASVNSVIPVVRPAQVQLKELFYSPVMIHPWQNVVTVCTVSKQESNCVCVTEASPQDCVTCDWGSTLKDKVCYPRCEEGRYFSLEVR